MYHEMFLIYTRFVQMRYFAYTYTDNSVSWVVVWVVFFQGDIIKSDTADMGKNH